MKKAGYILTLVAVQLAMWACQEIRPDSPSAGEGGVVFLLDSRDAVRLQTKSDAEDLLDGQKFSNVLVILVDNDNNVVGNVYKEYPYDPSATGNDAEQRLVSATSVTCDTISFKNLNPGHYTAYAYANINAAAWQRSGQEISASGQEKSKTSGSFSSFLDRELKAASPTPVAPTATSDTTMLLTGTASVPVGLSVETHTIQLQRPVVRLKVYVNNNTPYSVKVDTLFFSHFNPDKAYLISHCDESGIPSVPAGVNYGALPAYPILTDPLNPSAPPALVTVPPSSSPSYLEEYPVYETFLYENVSPNPYKVFAKLTLDPGGSAHKQMSLGQREFGIIDYDSLSAMDDGEEVDVLVFNPQKSVRSGRLLGSINSTTRQISWESAGYDNYSGFYGRADAVNEGDATYDYSSRYSWSNANGYSSWDGVAADGSTATSFSYNSGKNVQFFHRLVKSSGKFTLYGLAINPASENSIPNMILEKGKKNAKIADGTDNYLVKFKNASGKNLVSDVNWSQTVPDKVTYVKFDTASDNQDRQFMLFGRYCAGGMLKRILKESHKEVPLTYMSRNEDIKLVINVFFADQEATLNFDVDNSTWETMTESSHAFN